VFIFIVSLAAVHLIANIIINTLPHTITFIIGTSPSPLDTPYLRSSDIASTFSYIARNYVIRFIMYPALIFTFLIDHSDKERLLKIVNTKTILLAIICMWAAIIAISKGYIELSYGYGGWYILLAVIRFQSGAGFYIYAAITWTLLVTLSYYILQKKMPKHHALWITLLIFLSVQEVWEYSPFMWAYIIQGYHSVVLTTVTSIIWRAAPSFLLIFYAYKMKFNLNIRFLISFAISIAFSLLLIIRTDLYSIGPSLRILWSVTYVMYADCLLFRRNSEVEH